MAESRRSQATRAKAVRPGRKRNRWLVITGWVAGALLALGAVGFAALAVAYATIKIPDPNADFQTNTTFVYYNDGKEKIGSFQVQNRQTIPYAQMPQSVKDAIVAAENRTFWTDPGISVPGLMRASLGLIGLAPPDTTATGGGSTITQQYIKVMYLTQERSFTRKAKEILLAAKMGQQLTKEQILEGYLNTVYFGRGAYGIEAAAQTYFGKPAARLDLAEAVALSAIINSPANLDPANGEQQAADLLERYQYTLNGMVELGMVTAAEKLAIYNELPKFPKRDQDSQKGGPKGFLLKMVETELRAKGFTEEQVNGGGLKVVTTFDAKAQDAIVAAAQKMTLAAAGSKKAAADLHAGVASIDNATGGVLAIYGGPDFVKNSRNWATTTSPTGSTFKPYALTAALRDGWTLSDKLDGNTLYLPGVTKPVRNAGGANYGRVNLLTATTKSINTAYVDLTTQLSGGPEAVLRAANDAGAPTVEGWDAVPTAALGTPEVSPLYQAAAYSTFANQGERRAPHVVATATDASGQEVYVADTTPQQAIEPEVAIDVSYALSKVAQDGTGARASYLGYPVAGKTGTAYYSTAGATKTVAAWFVGYTRQITTAVMYVRGDQGNSDLGNSFYGSGYPAMTWLEYMRVAMAGKERIGFEPPTRRVSTQTPTPLPTTATPTPTETMPTPEPSPTDPGPSPTQPTDPPSSSAPPTTQPTQPTTAPPTATQGGQAP